jgi:hypothetical protein
MSKIAEVIERLERVEAAVGKIGHNGGPPLDDEPPAPKRSPGLLPDRLVAERYDVSVRTLERWDENLDLGFPPPVYILRRRYRDISKLDAWDRANARKVADPRNRVAAQALPRAQRGRFSKPREDTKR